MSWLAMADPMRAFSASGLHAQADGGDNISLGRIHGVQPMKSVTFPFDDTLAATPGTLAAGFSWELIQSKVIIQLLWPLSVLIAVDA